MSVTDAVMVTMPPPSAAGRPDPEQDLAAAHRGGVLVVLGAPGTGKTRTVVRSVQDRILRDGLDPDRCLVLAPTRQAAARLRDQIGDGLGRTFTEPLARTPASLAFAILRIAAAAEQGPLPRLISGAEQDVILRELLEGHREEGSGPPWPEALAQALPTRGFRAQLRDLLMRAVEHGLEPADLAGLGRLHDRPEWEAAAQVLAEYDEVTALSEPGSFDPAWICTAAADRLEEDEDLLELVRRRIQVIAVDDAQELTASADRLVRVLCAPGTDLLLAGDPDVTVEGFRGALPGRFLTLAADVAGAGGGSARRVVLRTRHDAVAPLVEVAGRVADRIGALAGAEHRRPLASSLSPGEAADVVQVAVARSRAQESAYLAHWLRTAHLRDGVAWSDMVVLARSGAVQDQARRALAAGGVPVRPDRSGTPLGQDQATQPLLTAFDVVTRALDAAWTTTPAEAVDLLTGPLGDVDPVHLRRLRRRLRAEEVAAGRSRTVDEVLADRLADPAQRPATPAQVHADLAPLLRVAGILDAGHAVATGGSDGDPGSAEDILWALWGASGLADTWVAQVEAGGALGIRADRDLDAVLVLFGAAQDYVERLPGRSARSFLDHVLGAEVAADTLVVGARAAESVEVLTPQAAAGRHWPVVAVAGVQDGVWPDLRLRDGLLGAEALVAALRGEAIVGAEGVRAAQSQVRSDELRQFHVAVSRADRQLLVTAVASTDEQPSSFLDLVDPDYRSRPAVEVPPPLTLRGLVGRVRREAVLAHRRGDVVARDQAVDALLLLAEAGVPGADPQRWWDLRSLSSSADLVPEGPVRVSPSRVQTYLDCPLRWFLTSRGADSGEAVLAEIGTLVHDVVAEAPEADAATLRAEVARRWPQLGLRPGWVADKQRTAAERMVDRYVGYVEQARASGRTLLGVERPLSVLVRGDDPVEQGAADEERPEPPEGGSTPDGARVPDLHLVGRVDRIERDPQGRVVVLDLKTSKSKPTKDELATHAQLASYQVAVEEGAFDDLAPGAGSGGAALVNLGIKEREVTQAQAPLSDTDDPGWARKMLLEAGAGMAGHRFPAHDQGQRCRRCPARFSCPLQPEGQAR